MKLRTILLLTLSLALAACGRSESSEAAAGAVNAAALKKDNDAADAVALRDAQDRGKAEANISIGLLDESEEARLKANER